MSKLIVCLGYRLKTDGSISPILENRIKDAVKICVGNENSILLLMGSSPYGNLIKTSVSEASVMNDYIKKNFSEEIKGVKIQIEGNTASAVEQLCYLKKFIEENKLNYSDVTIVSSEFFNERIKLFAEYILGTSKGVNFIGSAVPQDLTEKFKEDEESKFKDAKIWLENNYTKGDHEKILADHKAFQQKVINKEITNHRIS